MTTSPRTYTTLRDSIALFDDSRTLSQLIGRPTTPMAETVRAALA